ncbi:E3 ubiquitin/ISG15 ligase TRIM25-like [Pseudophryne corroboree]|uniref:E3 ubiquitin/ISG15 ligase TRIM25-like n=1 Tax=Pseudophryne corroboree TaxID=495146 RepID=UPI0030818134
MFAMASADLRRELDCSICLNIYTDPVTLRCGHNFCRVCIDHVLDTQEESGAFTCPECRAEYPDRPAPEINRKLCNIAERVRSIPEEGTGVFCTYCVHSQVPVLKTCLKCEASLCDIHWRTHNKSAEHVLVDPTTSLEKRICSVHKEILKYFCTEDAVCICVSCSLAGEHRGHLVEMLGEASEKKKEKLRNVLQKLTTKREETEKSIQSLQERMREDHGKAAGLSETITALYRDIRIQLEDLEKRVLNEISRQEERVSLSVSDLIQQLAMKKDEMARKMRHIEELCNMPDPMTVLQEPDTGDLSDTEELCCMIDPMTTVQKQDSEEKMEEVVVGGTEENEEEGGTENEEEGGTEENEEEGETEEKGTEEGDREEGRRHDEHKVGDLDVGLISGELQTLSDIIKGINVCFYVQKPEDISLDVNTAGDYIVISGDMKTASTSSIEQNHPETPERFQDHSQVLSTRRFYSGQHYWDVDVSKSESWSVGMCYPSIDRRGDQSLCGYNNKSWCLDRDDDDDDEYSVIHDGEKIPLSDSIPYDRVRMYLDYEAGQLSFYSLCDMIRHLHTVTATFTEPLHAILGVWEEGSIKILV